MLQSLHVLVKSRDLNSVYIQRLDCSLNFRAQAVTESLTNLAFLSEVRERSVSLGGTPTNSLWSDGQRMVWSSSEEPPLQERGRKIGKGNRKQHC